MTLKAICRIGDHVTGTCTAHDTPRTFTGYWTVGSTYVKADGIGVVRKDDTGVTDCGHTIKATGTGSYSTADNKLIHRVDDAVIVVEGGYGHSYEGSPNYNAE